MIPYRLIRSDRRTICIQLTAEGEVLVRAPRRCGQAEIDAFVERQAAWIQKHRATVLERKARQAAFSLTEGCAFTICGEEFRVHIVPGLSPRLHRDQLILPGEDLDRTAVLRLIRERGRPWLRQRLDHWAAVMGITYRDLTINTARKRWGSCSSHGSIHISVFLLLAPARDIDYVLVHELAHRRHFDHSPAFWALVGSVLPDYAERRKELRRVQEDPFLRALAAKESE